MELARGSRLGPYELLAALGAGGMGEVYRARDTRLGRDVALKVPAADRLTDPAARARFDREMAVVARLAHPRICTLLDAGVHDERPYFSMELLSGETLQVRLERAGGRGLPLAETLGIAAALCDALAYAHRQGVVHRDVKPANVMLTPNGVKLLDFGVARLRANDAPVDARAATAPLTILGTPAYMAPEQIDGQADGRADLFSLGAVIYEMLCGERAFPGETSSEILGAVVRCTPRPLVEFVPGVPPALARIVHRCLRKPVEERWQSAADLQEALQLIGSPPIELPSTRAARSRWAVAGAGVGAAALVAVAAVAFAPSFLSPASPPGLYVDDIELPDGETVVAGQSAWSRDGRHVALVTQHAGSGPVDFKLWTLEVGGGRGWQLVDGAGPEHVTYPTWSPDGRSLAYFRSRKLVRVALPSQVPVPLADAPDGRGAAWLDSDTIVYAPEPQGDLWQISADGGTPAVALRRGDGDLGLKFPTALRGAQLLFWGQRSTQADSEIRVTSLGSHVPPRTLTASANAGAIAGDHLFFVRDNVIVAQPIDSRTWTLTGRPEQVAVETGRGGNLGAPYITSGGDVVGAASVHREESLLTWVDRTGATLGGIGGVAPYRTMALSPRGDRVLVEAAAPGVDQATILLIDLQTGTPRQIVTDVGAMHPIWHPDPDRVAFRASRGPGGSGAILEYTLSGRSLRTLLDTPTMASARPAAWIDARRLLWWAADATGRFNGIFVRDAAGSDRPVRTIRFGADIRTVTLRPDAAAVAYSSNESGVFEVYVDTLPPSGGSPAQISRGGGSLPRWSRDGGELFFLADGALHVVAMDGTRGAALRAPQRLFAYDGQDYDVHPDGRLLIERTRVPERHYLRVFRHWSRRPPPER